ncbi:MAG TPA: hypothetical protein VGL00_03285 [Terracidiphilus sp.]
MKALLRKVVPGAAILTALLGANITGYGASSHDGGYEFRTSDRCVACHNGLKTKGGEDISIGFEWRASVMANSARDPYWQGSVRRETIDHPESSAAIQNECSTCHMPVSHFIAESEGKDAQVFAHLPLNDHHQASDVQAADGVSCSVCHQIEPTGLGTAQSFSGQVKFATIGGQASRPEFGPFVVDPGHQRIMYTSTQGFVPTVAGHIRDSALCGSCHTLYTKARGAGGKELGTFPEQMPYLEWLHSDYPAKYTCQGCHMPEVAEPVKVAAVFGPERQGMHRHVFVGGNVLLERILNDHRTELDVQALPQELTDATERTRAFLEHSTATVSIDSIETTGKTIRFAVRVVNLTGHKLPTAYPSRRAWLHVTVRDQHGRIVFESGHLHADGSIAGNDNDADPLKFEPHYAEITRPDQVEIFEPILKDAEGRVTTGLISAVGYLKDNRLLPSGFDKGTAGADIAVVGEAHDDPNFNDRGSVVRYAVDSGGAAGPFHIEAELWYQPVGFRWAHNLEPYKAAEPQRFVGYYEAESQDAAVVLAMAQATR